MLLPPACHVLLNSLWCSWACLINHKICTGALTSHNLVAQHLLSWMTLHHYLLTGTKQTRQWQLLVVTLTSLPSFAELFWLLSWVLKFWSARSKVSGFARLTASDVRRVSRPRRASVGQHGVFLFGREKVCAEGRRMYFRNTYPFSMFLGISICLDVAVVEAYLSICGRRVEGLLGSESGL